ncbi:DUF4188 domain-containing protein [Bacillus sp. CECT 9360]|uniref:DUF4188 domain-containing protein n=1 Tax=Bacillus sp. CECT 9360 TaxID=2845821 RepID=UPI001E34203E|nr:DUF4188 domain-containing protein [Bacillus sp. CECT 9360]CAH0344752.1 hypothetical protein BCI9360_01018 [Bacillus sp. CECT 9360]
MGKRIFPGRYTADHEGEIVIFIIGMRVNKWWAIHKWGPVFKSMPPMIRELFINQEHGCLSMETFWGLRSTLVVQYWRSTEDLLSYAKGQKHLTSWEHFNKKAGNNDAVGIYHETYVVPKGQYESIYGYMPKFGLARVSGHKAITPSLNSARRLKA